MHLWFYLPCWLGGALGISPNENWFSAECSISLNMYSISGAPGEDETRPWVWDSSSDQPLIISNPLHHQTSHQSTYPSINIFRLRHLHLHLRNEDEGHHPEKRETADIVQTVKGNPYFLGGVSTHHKAVLYLYIHDVEYDQFIKEAFLRQFFSLLISQQLCFLASKQLVRPDCQALSVHSRGGFRKELISSAHVPLNALPALPSLQKLPSMPPPLLSKDGFTKGDSKAHSAPLRWWTTHPPLTFFWICETNLANICQSWKFQTMTQCEPYEMLFVPETKCVCQIMGMTLWCARSKWSPVFVRKVLCRNWCHNWRGMVYWSGAKENFFLC